MSGKESIHWRVISLILVCVLCACSDKPSSSGSSTIVDDDSPSAGDSNELEVVNSHIPLTGAAEPGFLPVPRVTVEDSQLVFNWDNIAGRYQVKLMQLNLTAREFFPIFETQGDLVTSFTYPVDSIAFNWSETRFTLEACDVDECLRSASVPVSHLQALLMQPLPLDNAQPDDRFGTKIKINSVANGAVVGVPAASHSDYSNSGELIPYFRVGNRWWQEARLRADNAKDGANLGSSVDISDDGTLIVAGAPNSRNSNASTGSVSLFQRSGEGWINTSTLVSDSPTTQQFGSIVKLSGDGNTLVTAASDEKYLWIYQRVSSQWQLIQQLTTVEGTTASKNAIDFSLSNDGQLLFVDSALHIDVYQYTVGMFKRISQISITGSTDNRQNVGFAIDAKGKTLVATTFKPASEGTDPVTHLSIFAETDAGRWESVQRLMLTIASTTTTPVIAVSADGGTIALAVESTPHQSGIVITYTKQSLAPGGYKHWRAGSTFTDPAAEFQSTHSGYASAVSLSGDGKTMMVGAPLGLDEDNQPTGAVYIY